MRWTMLEYIYISQIGETRFVVSPLGYHSDNDEKFNKRLSLLKNRRMARITPPSILYFVRLSNTLTEIHELVFFFW